ncbi:hypothetical protein GCM10023185_16900 [Hymenobacter saemangeumensis]|uniref:T9SS type A sorting domain-containing protein n=1 Tax=Hymenobacter saemangeumensis TaxID=1084522 RepID=A0ABP8IAN0_9BACT
MNSSLLAGPVRHLSLAYEAQKHVVQVGYILTEAATTEVVLCDLTGRVLATIRATRAQAPGAYAYSYTYDPGLARRYADTYLLAFYCNGIKVKTRIFHFGT